MHDKHVQQCLRQKILCKLKGYLDGTKSNLCLWCAGNLWINDHAYNFGGGNTPPCSLLVASMPLGQTDYSARNSTCDVKLLQALTVRAMKVNQQASYLDRARAGQLPLSAARGVSSIFALRYVSREKWEQRHICWLWCYAHLGEHRCILRTCRPIDCSTRGLEPFMGVPVAAMRSLCPNLHMSPRESRTCN